MISAPQRLGHRLGRERDRRLEVLDDGGDLAAVAAADAVDLFDDLAVVLHEPRVERMRLLEALEVLHRDADVEVVGAGRQDVLARRRRLARDHRIDVRVEEHRAAAARAAGRASRRSSCGNVAPAFSAACAAAANASGVHFSTNFRAVRLLYGPVLIQNSFV